ncbi:B-box zinc finger protein 20-like [Lolium rigidum]|uniref:B-box zinc finger protein 20-like n=1 Tax=Lolium rigidum TaxID=89674 RepID=UPI001F5E2987|nr:B-box zinc finger protein 20-like [Lolium rigidum]
MKVQCDVCAAQAASVFCCADEAALCDACDHRVHRANKLAGKHRRLSLLHPPPSSSSPSSSDQKPPPCDICQEKRGFLFCKEDRAILCRECDVRVHTTSDLTRRHSRFLLTGVRVSSAPVDSPAPSDQEQAQQHEEEEENNSSPCNADSYSGGSASATASPSDGSSISEYLTKTLPGWHVEDFFLDDAAAAATVAVSSDKQYQGGMAQIGGPQQDYPSWAGQEQLIGGVVVTAAGERARRELWVPQMQVEAQWASSKRPRASSSGYSYW